MITQSGFVRILWLTLLTGMAGIHSMADEVAPEPALAQRADGALDWGPCPPFLPEGCAIAVLHGDPAQDKLDVFFKVPGGSTLPAHWHTSAERMVLVSGELRVTYAGQNEVVLTPGSYAYGPPGRVHEGFCASSGPCILFIAFDLPLDAFPVEPAGQ